ncbi:MAG: type III secretion system chaperone [Bordetella sp.]|uniref:type III secretion system chaperone n=1 Tax=Bordetella sp. TaxID=28081 RepID=UPI003F7BAF70
MDKRDLASRLLADLGNTLTVGPLALDAATQSCVLVFDDNLILNIEYDPGTERLVLSCYLDELPSEGAEPLLRELLAANLYWHRTRGATLCLEEGTGGIILTYPCSVTELDSHAFETVVENFANQAERWTRRIAQARQAAPVSPAMAMTDSTLPPTYA